MRGGRDRQESFAYGINYHSEEGRTEGVGLLLFEADCTAATAVPRSSVRSFGRSAIISRRQKSYVGISLLFIPSRLARFSDLLTAAAAATARGELVVNNFGAVCGLASPCMHF